VSTTPEEPGGGDVAHDHQPHLSPAVESFGYLTAAPFGGRAGSSVVNFNGKTSSVATFWVGPASAIFGGSACDHQALRWVRRGLIWNGEALPELQGLGALSLMSFIASTFTLVQNNTAIPRVLRAHQLRASQAQSFHLPWAWTKRLVPTSVPFSRAIGPPPAWVST